MGGPIASLPDDLHEEFTMMSLPRPPMAGRLSLAAASLVLVASLAACGGGSDSVTTTKPIVDVPAPTAEAIAASQAVVDVSSTALASTGAAFTQAEVATVQTAVDDGTTSGTGDIADAQTKLDASSDLDVIATPTAASRSQAK